MNKKKIFNDPVYGFITIPYEIIFNLIEHPYFQRLRHISQLGLTHLVYPGALHTRFGHALGSLHLMNMALDTLKSKGHKISEAECEAVSAAILMHDIGHGPYSHALESSIVKGVAHEDISLMFIDRLNKIYNGDLSMTIEIFKNNYKKPFLHQLVSSQLDLDRLDYLCRDSFFTGVAEGVVGYQRIISMLDIHKDNLVVEEKGIYSVEKFLISRRLMYWQVYYHKTSLSAQNMIVKILKRAKELANKGIELFATPALKYFLYNNVSKAHFETDTEVLEKFAQLDDFDVFSSVKEWKSHDDIVLSRLSWNLSNRNLYKIKIQNEPFDEGFVNDLQDKMAKQYNIDKQDADYLVFTDVIKNDAYLSDKQRINILYKDKTIKDIAEASDNLNIKVLSNPVEKYYLCFPKEVNFKYL